jgi:DNA-binding NarL/FixJ family response regulator
LEQKLHEVEAACEHWLDSPRQQLKRVAEEHQAAVAEDLNNLSKDAAVRAIAMVARAERKVAEMIEQRLHSLVVAAVREHVTSASFEEDGLTNKQIAAARGISLRAVKRLRRVGLA